MTLKHYRLRGNSTYGYSIALPTKAVQDESGNIIATRWACVIQVDNSVVFIPKIRAKKEVTDGIQARPDQTRMPRLHETI